MISVLNSDGSNHSVGMKTLVDAAISLCPKTGKTRIFYSNSRKAAIVISSHGRPFRIERVK